LGCRGCGRGVLQAATGKLYGEVKNMFRDVLLRDKEVFLKMVEKFYSSSAVLHPVDPKNFEITFTLAIDKSPFVRILIIENDETPIGFAQLSFTYSMEAGGMVLLLEDAYIDETHRGGGHGGKLMCFLEKEYPTFKRFRLEVMHDNTKAINLFKNAGYEVFNYMQMVKDF
jgi:GNAT superfamily N-acetyltransferase